MKASWGGPSCKWAQAPALPALPAYAAALSHIFTGMEAVVRARTASAAGAARAARKKTGGAADACCLLLSLLQDGLAEKIGWKEGSEAPRKLRDAPFVQIPLGVTEDRLVGTVDIEASMKVQDPSRRIHPHDACTAIRATLQAYTCAAMRSSNRCFSFSHVQGKETGGRRRAGRGRQGNAGGRAAACRGTGACIRA